MRRRRVIALCLGAALLAAAAPADADDRRRDRDRRTSRNLRPKPRARVAEPRPGVSGAGWVNMLNAAAVARPGAHRVGLARFPIELAIRAYAGPWDRLAAPEQIAAQLDGWTEPGALGVRHTLAATPVRVLAADTVVGDLGAGHPLLALLRDPSGTGGRTYVLTAMSYDTGPLGQVLGRTVTLRDPRPGAAGAIVEIPWADLGARFRGAVRIDVGSW